MLHCDLRVRWKVASDLRFRAAISEPQTPSFCGISGDLAPSTWKSLAIAIVRFWCAKNCTRSRSGRPDHRPDVPGLTPSSSPGHFQGVPTTNFLYAQHCDPGRHLQECSGARVWCCFPQLPVVNQFLRF